MLIYLLRQFLYGILVGDVSDHDSRSRVLQDVVLMQQEHTTFFIPLHAVTVGVGLIVVGLFYEVHYVLSNIDSTSRTLLSWFCNRKDTPQFRLVLLFLVTTRKILALTPSHSDPFVFDLGKDGIEGTLHDFLTFCLPNCNGRWGDRSRNSWLLGFGGSLRCCRLGLAKTVRCLASSFL